MSQFFRYFFVILLSYFEISPSIIPYITHKTCLPYRYTFKSGNPEHPGDKFYNTTVEVLPEDHVSKQSGVLDNAAHSHPYPKTDDSFLVIGNFNHVSGAAENTVDPTLGKINTLRLRVLTQSESWVILNEVRMQALLDSF